jgi:hypothetical protein
VTASRSGAPEVKAGGKTALQHRSLIGKQPGRTGRRPNARASQGHQVRRSFLYWRVLFEPAHFPMERKMLLGIKHRAEAGQGTPADAPLPLVR